MSPITTHVLDTSRGVPAEGVPVSLEILGAKGEWKTLAKARTDADGRIADLLPKRARLKRGVYRIVFETAAYFRSIGEKEFYPLVLVAFTVQNPKEHFHVPLLLSPFGYCTYRGS